MSRTRPVILSLILALVGLGIAGCPKGPGSFTLGAEARLEFSPSTVSFTDVARGQVAYRVITVRHIGTGGTIFLDPITLNTESPDLSIGTIERTQLEPGEESRIQIVYNSDHDEPDQGELVIGHNLASGTSTSIPIWTPGQRANLVANPGAVDFGIVQEGAPSKVAVKILNVGSAPATLVDYVVSEEDEDKDFGAEFQKGVVIPPEGHVTIDITYAPTGRDADAASITLITDREDVSTTLSVVGQEETPVLVVEPNTVQLGWVEPQQEKLVTIKVRNEGNTELVVNNFTLIDANPALALIGVPVTPFELEPGDGMDLGVLFSPPDSIPMTGDPLGSLVIESNDEARNPFTLPIFGAAGIPNIVVVPEDVVDFAYVAEGFAAERNVTILNIGEQAVTIEKAEFTEMTTDEFSFVNEAVLPVTINPGEAVDLALSFDNQGGSKGSEFARFFFYTDDPLVPSYALDVVARRAERPTCEPSFVPELLSMGATKEGTVLKGTLKVVNYGSGNCEYREYEMDGCLKIQSGVRHRFDCTIQGLVTPFTVGSAPPYGKILGPGKALDFEIEFTAPPVENLELGRDNYYGRIALLMHDPNINGFKYVAPPGGWLKGVNLQAQSAIPTVVVDPPELDFGLVRTDCESNDSFVTVTNTGPVPAEVTNIDVSGCSGTVDITGVTFPATVPGYSTTFFETRFGPNADGPMTCTLEVDTNATILNWNMASSASIPAAGIGIDTAHKIDTFLQEPPPKVDVLFVIDDSWSMADEQVLLKQELPKLVSIATQWGQDYRIGITTTDTIMVKGEFQGNPKIGKPGDDISKIAQNLVVGVTGHYEEMGLESAWMALSGVNMADTGIPCLDVPGQCPKYDNNNYFWCTEGYCRGPNYGFLRDDAELVIIIVSDEEDSSPYGVSWYVSQFSALKAKDSGVGVKLHAIVTDEEGCFGGFGTIGYRYELAVKAFDGHLSSICATDFSAEFSELGNKTFGLKERFYPTLPLDPETLVVRVDGEVCESGWTWNLATKSVVFDKEGPCFPDFGQTVELEYDVLCASPSGG